jgi:hypothetical protein
MSIWDFIALFFWSWVFIAFLMVVFSIVGDLFRDDNVGGVVKALWMIALVFVPVITALIYLIARGKGMAQRQAEAARHARAETEDYIRTTAGTASPTQDIASAHSLLQTGAITQAEYDALKARALAGGQRVAASA